MPKGTMIMAMRKTGTGMQRIWQMLAEAMEAAGTETHLDRLIDLIGADISHDLVTVARYSTTKAPQFVKHRGFSDELVNSYLAHYYVFDPFYAAWRRERRHGIVPLKGLADDEVKRGQYIAGFLAESEICDEVGIMLADGGDDCLGIFLDRTTRPFTVREIKVLNERLPAFEALHALDVKARAAEPARNGTPNRPGISPTGVPHLPEGLWPDLSMRERQLVQLILAGHPTATIADRLGITIGTTKNHRRRIYDKLDITTERELFLQFFQFGVHVAEDPQPA